MSGKLGNLVSVALASTFVVHVGGCKPSREAEARSARLAGNLREAVRLYDQAVAESPDDARLVAEAKHVKGDLVAVILASNSPDKPEAAEDAKLATEYLEQLGRKDELPRAYKQWANALEKKGEHSAALGALHQMGSNTGRDGEADDLIASLLQRHPETAEAASEFERLLGAHSESGWICSQHAGWLAERQQYQHAIDEYTRCQGITPQSFDQALYYGAQLATLREYVKRAARKGRLGCRAKRGRGR